jgi:hypothetical protein
MVIQCEQLCGVGPLYDALKLEHTVLGAACSSVSTVTNCVPC